jgi:S-adenosylmethionine-dependent methyltransferase
VPTRAPHEQTVRDRLLWRLLGDALGLVSRPGSIPLVLDCGGGTGRYAVPLAQRGAEVTVVDISADALATLRRRAEEAGVADHIHAVQGDIETLDVAGGRFDLALVHGLLEAIDNAEIADVALGIIAEAVRPDGLVSILVANPVATVLSSVLAGDLGAAYQQLTKAAGGLDLATLTRLCRRHGLRAEHSHGIGVFADLMPEARFTEPHVIVAIEEVASGRPPYRDIAARLHVLARRAAG